MSTSIHIQAFKALTSGINPYTLQLAKAQGVRIVSPTVLRQYLRNLPRQGVSAQQVAPFNPRSSQPPSPAMEGAVIYISPSEATELLKFCCSDLKTYEPIDAATGPAGAFTPLTGFQQPGGVEGQSNDASGGLMSFVRLLPRDMQTHLDGLTGFVGSVRDAVVGLSIPSPPRVAVRSGPLAAGAGASGSTPQQQLASVQSAANAPVAGTGGEPAYNQAKLQECKGLPCPTASNTNILLGIGARPLLFCTPSVFPKVAQLLPASIASSLLSPNAAVALGEHLQSSDFTSTLDLRRFNLHDLAAKLKDMLPAAWYVAPRPPVAVANQRAAAGGHALGSRVVGSGEVCFSAGCPSLTGVLWTTNGLKEGPSRWWLEHMWLLVQELRNEEDDIAAVAATAAAAAAARAAAIAPPPLALPPPPPPPQNAPIAPGPPRVPSPAAAAAEADERDDSLIALDGWPLLPTVGTCGRLLHVAARKAILALPDILVRKAEAGAATEAAAVSQAGAPVAAVLASGAGSIPKTEDKFDFEALVSLSLLCGDDSCCIGMPFHSGPHMR